MREYLPSLNVSILMLEKHRLWQKEAALDGDGKSGHRLMN